MPGKRHTGGDQTRGPLTTAEREQILDLAAAGRGRNEIAEEVGRSPGTVTKVCKAAGLDFSRAATQVATEARKVDLAAMRSRLEQESWVQYGLVLARLEQPARLIQFSGTLGQWSEKDVDTIPAKDLADLARAAKDLASAGKLLADANREQKVDDALDGLDAWLATEIDGTGRPGTPEPQEHP